LWKQRNLVYINSRYSFLYVMEHLSDVYEDWKMFNQVFEQLGYVVINQTTKTEG
jgi:hypothetical protein